MKKLILIALIFSIITGFAVFSFAAKLEHSTDIVTKSVVVAATSIPENTIITEEMLVLKQFPAEAVHALAASQLAEAVGRISKVMIEADEQILTTRLSDSDQENDNLSFVISPNYRALTIKTDEISGVAGYINKGDKIDILAVLLKAEGETTSIISQMVAENIEVLEVGIKPLAESKEETEYTSITVLILEKDILRVNYALSEGKYRLVLRSVVDEKLVNPPPYTP